MNIKEIAQLAEVSPSTVSRVLNGKKVRDDAYERITAVIKQYDYVPNFIGRNLRTQKTNKILVLVPTIQNSFYSDMIASFEERARAAGFTTLLGVTNRNVAIEKQYLNLLYSHQVDGVASFIPTLGVDEIDNISAQYPYVAMCWRGSPNSNVNYVCIDNNQASYDITKYMISLGHTRIAIMNGDFAERTYELERDEGFYRAMADAGLKTRDAYRVVCDYDYQSAYDACKRLMSLPNPPTAILAMSDIRAMGVLLYLQEAGLTAGVDVDVVGFDNLDLSQMIHPKITTVAQPRIEIGEEAADLLIRLIGNNNKATRGIVLKYKLIIRETTRKLETKEQRGTI